MKSFLSRRFSTHLLSERRLNKARDRAERKRRHKGEPHRIEFFHQVDDPYSHLLAQALLKLLERYEVQVDTWLVEPPEDWAAPARSRLESYSLVDARRLAKKAGFQPTNTERPSPERVLDAQRALAATLAAPEEPGGQATLETAVATGERLWATDAASAPTDAGDPADAGTDARLEAALRSGTERRSSLGHYLGGTCFYGGEWTWGIDRLAYLEERLADLGTRRPDAGPGKSAKPIYLQPRWLQQPVSKEAAGRPHLPDLHFFASFRSPYTAIATERTIRLAEEFGVDLRIRFVLPMVMRGLPVKRAKRLYILRDAAREARRIGVPFGPIADPVGKPVERGYSLLPWAIDEGRGTAYFQSFMTLVWSQGVDAGSDRGLRRIVEAAGLDWQEGRRHLDDPAWLEQAELNRQELFDLGLWGVPSFRIGSLAVWGQDRLWAIEDEYRRLLGE